jgi:hypothetical protein
MSTKEIREEIVTAVQKMPEKKIGFLIHVVSIFFERRGK